MAQYIDAEKLKEELYEIRQDWLDDSTVLEAELDAVKCVLSSIDYTIDSLQQEQPTNTDNLCSELADFLIRNDIQEEKAKSLANRIADEYGSKRYIDGLCDGFKEEQSKILEVKDGNLEKEISDYLTSYHLHIKDGGRVVFDNNDSPNFMCDIRHIAKHFFELGIQQPNHFIDWQRNSDINKPSKNHSILMQTTHGIAEGEWNGEKWIQYRWNSFIKDEDVLAWIELSNIEIPPNVSLNLDLKTRKEASLNQ